MIKIAITQGDFNGVGPEVAVKALADPTVTELFTPVLFMDKRIFDRACEAFRPELPAVAVVTDAAHAEPGRINIVDLRLPDVTIEPGRPSAVSGRGALASLEAATKAVTDGHAEALVTAPISKEAIQGEGFHFAGHTEYLESKAPSGHRAQMIMVNSDLRVALLTTHLPVSDIAGAITAEGIEEAVKALAASISRDFGIQRPRLALLSLNPHCGDGGLLGTEEIRIINPAIEACTEQGLLTFGPFAADGFFGSGAYKHFDGILAMYHDQGLGPFKTLAANLGVNFTAGLPFVRTSPDHGTACDIAWRGIADPASMRNAIYMAIDIVRARRRHDEATADPLPHQSPERGARQRPRPDKGFPAKGESKDNEDKDADQKNCNQ